MCKPFPNMDTRVPMCSEKGWKNCSLCPNIVPTLDRDPSVEKDWTDKEVKVSPPPPEENLGVGKSLILLGHA